MIMRRLLLTFLITGASLSAYYYCYDYYQHRLMVQLMQKETKSISIHAETPVATIKIDSDNDVEWALVAKLLTIILTSYGGIRVINKFTK